MAERTREPAHRHVSFGSGITRQELPLAAQVYAALADGRFRSGEDLAQALGVTRGAIWKAAVSLRSLGVVIHAVRNRGYRLATPCEMLESSRIGAAIPADVSERVRQIEVAWSLESTNAALLARGDLPPGRCDVLLAEYQTAGRGRRGRTWLAPPGGAICLSLSWMFPEVPRDVGGLGLAVGVCALRALREQGVENLELKWPNDLLFERRKLGGILIEMRAESAGPTYVVIGLGLNVSLGARLLEEIAATGTQAADLRAAGLAAPARNALVAGLATSIVRGLREFEKHGLRPFIEEWRNADALRGRPVSVHAGEQETKGIARGVDVTGALLVETPQGLRKFISGEVTVRPDA